MNEGQIEINILMEIREALTVYISTGDKGFFKVVPCMLNIETKEGKKIKDAILLEMRYMTKIGYDGLKKIYKKLNPPS